MIVLLIVISFIALLCIIFAKDSFLNKEFYIYNLVSQYPYLKREFILNTYKAWYE